MATSEILAQYVEVWGWDAEAVTEVLAEYIDRQQADDAFRDYLDEVVAREEAAQDEALALPRLRDLMAEEPPWKKQE
jgi:hypothetical protein